MTDNALDRGIAIREEKAALERFAVAVENAIWIPSKALPEDLRNKMSADGLVANLDALLKLWVDQKIGGLDQELAAL